MSRLSDIMSLPRLDAEAIALLGGLAPAGSDQTPVLELLDLFFSTTPGRFALIEKALESGDSKTLSEQAHCLKSAAISIGAGRLSKIFLALEKTAAGDQDETRALFSAARSEYESVRDVLVKEFGEFQKSP
jgi:HPt (histidine-containing phosphotransfer) domain-containing protein